MNDNKYDVTNTNNQNSLSLDLNKNDHSNSKIKTLLKPQSKLFDYDIEDLFSEGESIPHYLIKQAL